MNSRGCGAAQVQFGLLVDLKQSFIESCIFFFVGANDLSCKVVLGKVIFTYKERRRILTVDNRQFTMEGHLRIRTQGQLRIV